MKENGIKKITVLALSALLLCGLLGTVLFRTDDVSAFERRKLAKFPKLSLSSVLSGRFFTDFESWAQDRFVLRDGLRGAAAASRLYLFMQRDSNGLSLHDGVIYKPPYPLDSRQAGHAADKLASIAATLPETAHAYYAVIPDKSRYAPAAAGLRTLDFDALSALMDNALSPLAEKIELSDVLSLSDYYRTDTHWRQERLLPVCRRLLAGMGLSDAPETAYEARTLPSFYGVLYGQLALPAQAEPLTYLTNADLDNASVFRLETGTVGPVYALEKANGADPYDLFLYGASSLLTVTNENAATDRRLVLFRDSYGSAIAPLLLSGYREITLVDLRYLPSALLSDYFTITDQDVLFLYSELMLNGGDALR